MTDFERMMESQNAEEPAAGALALVQLGGEQKSLPVLLTSARADAALVHRASRSLAWLPWDERLRFFRELRSLEPGDEPLAEIVSMFGRASDERAIPPLWEMLANEMVSAELAIGVAGALLHQYYGDNYYDPSRIPAADRKRALSETREKAASGPEWQRAAALALMATVSQDDAAELARKVFDDASLGETLRRNALQNLLLCQSEADAQRLAVAALSGHELSFRRLALIFLARGSDGIRNLQQDVIPLYLPGSYTHHSRERPAVPQVPNELDEPLLRQLLGDPEPEIAAYAGYFLALQEHTDGLRTLLSYWRTKAMNDEVWIKLVYRAIAATGDDSHIPLLEEIYNRLDADNTEEAKDLYWTIRAMDGPQVLKLRKRIRDEVGMENLR